ESFDYLGASGHGEVMVHWENPRSQIRDLGYPLQFMAIDDQRLADNVFNTHTRIECGVWVLEDDLQATPQLAQLPCCDGQQVVAIERDCAGVGFDEAQQQASDGTFA